MEQFQSTRPSRGETVMNAELKAIGAISIHSPLAGRDRKKSQSTSYKNHSYCTTHILADSK